MGRDAAASGTAARGRKRHLALVAPGDEPAEAAVQGLRRERDLAVTLDREQAEDAVAAAQEAFERVRRLLEAPRRRPRRDEDVVTVELSVKTYEGLEALSGGTATVADVIDRLATYASQSRPRDLDHLIIQGYQRTPAGRMSRASGRRLIADEPW